MKNGKRIIILIIGITLLSSCLNSHGLSAKTPITLTLWHNYGGQMKDTMDEMVDEFNETIGAEKGVILNVTSISSSALLHEKLAMIANGDPGAPEMPDITTANPKTAILLEQKGLLANLSTQFSKEELAAYVPKFIEEGMVNGKDLSVFPTAKSTEVLYLNKTIFDRFAKEADITLKELETFEGIARAAGLYYDWTDAQTPDIKNDGKAFYHSDSLLNFTLIGCEQLSENLIKDHKFDYSTKEFEKIWRCFYEPAVKGHFAIFDGYASDLAKTGDIVCSTGSTAGVVFFSPTVTYSDNTTEPAELMILPYPVFEGGKKIAVQRGGGMVVAKSSEAKEYASGIFLKWFTSPKNNIRFISSTGYLPVTVEAFGKVMTDEITKIEDENVKTLLHTATSMRAEYDFYIPPIFDGIDILQKDFETKFKQVATESRNTYQKLLINHTPEVAFELATKDGQMLFSQQ